MNRTHGCLLAIAAVIGALSLPCYPADEPTPASPRTRRNDRGRQVLPANAEILTVAGKVGFLAMPENVKPGRKTPWLWYFPTDYDLPGKYEKWMFELKMSGTTDRRSASDTVLQPRCHERGVALTL
jgi:hypothetical protein